MRRFFVSLGLLSLLSFSVAAHADTIPAGTYTFSAETKVLESTPTDALSGTLTIGSNGLVTAANITLTDLYLGQITFTGNNGISAAGPDGWDPLADHVDLESSGTSSKDIGWSGQLVLYYLPMLDSNGNITVCIQGVVCNDYQKSYVHIYSPNTPASDFNNYNPDPLISGSITASAPTSGPTAVTPEPSSLTLLGTGILACAGLARRKFLKA